MTETKKELEKVLERVVECYRNFGSAYEDDLRILLNAGMCDGNRGKLIKTIAKLSR